MAVLVALARCGKWSYEGLMRYYATLSVVLLGLQGCTGPVETNIHSAGVGVQDAAALMWMPAPKGAEAEGPHMLAARAAVAAALQERGFHMVEEAPAAVSIGFAERPATIGLKAGQGKALSPAKEERLFQNCADRMMRLRISIVDRANGDQLYSGEAQESHCHAQASDVLARLAEHVVDDIDSPRGERKSFSLAKD